MKIENTVALVTGANRGIGAALVHALLETGASKVYAAARQEADLATVGAKGDRRIVPVHLDVTNAAHVARVAGQASDVSMECEVPSVREGEWVSAVNAAAAGGHCRGARAAAGTAGLPQWRVVVKPVKAYIGTAPPLSDGQRGSRGRC